MIMETGPSASCMLGKLSVSKPNASPKNEYISIQKVKKKKTRHNVAFIFITVLLGIM